MIDCAVVLSGEVAGEGGEDRGFPREILGLTFLKRSLLALDQSGVRRAVYVHGNQDAGKALAIIDDAGLRAKGLSVTAIPAAGAGSLVSPCRSGGATAVVLPEHAVFDHRIISVSAEAGAGRKEKERVGDILFCPVHSLAELAEILTGGEKAQDFFLTTGKNRCLREGNSPGGPELFSITVTSPDTYREAEGLLLESVRKETDGFVARHLNRPISLFLSRYFISFGLSPNQISLGNLAVGLIGAWLTAVGGYGRIVIGAALFQLTSVLDGSDGEVAKLTYSGTERGAWVDTVCDELTTLAYFVCLPIGLYRTYDNPVYLVIGGTTLLSGAALYGLMVRHLRRCRAGGSMLHLLREFEEASNHPGLIGAVSTAVTSLDFVVRRDFFSFAIFVLCLTGRADLIVWTIGFLVPAGAVYMAWISSHFRSLRGARRETAGEGGG